MADFIKGLFAGQQKVANPHSGGDDGTHPHHPQNETFSSPIRAFSPLPPAYLLLVADVWHG